MRLDHCVDGSPEFRTINGILCNLILAIAGHAIDRWLKLVHVICCMALK